MGSYKCKNCLYLDDNNYNRITGKYYCKERRYYVVWDSGSCSSFKLAPHKKNLYVATKAMELANVPVENDTYMDIRALRDTLEEKEEYQGLLDVYDIVAPVIAHKMGEDEYGVENAIISINNFMEPCAILVRQNKIDEAAALYQQMVEELMQVYGITLLNAKEMDGYSFEQNNTCVVDYDKLMYEPIETYDDILDLPRKRIRTKKYN